MNTKSSRASHRPGPGLLFSTTPSKSQIQQEKIVEAAIEAFAKHGIEKTTYTALARKCKVSRPLIHHYFPTLDDLFLVAARYARATLLSLAKEGMESGRKTDNPEMALEGYVRGCFRWIELFPEQMKFWLLFYYQAGLGGQALKDNTALVDSGHARITQLLEEGRQKSGWEFKDGVATAKMIQLQITGALVSSQTENGYLTREIACDLTLELVWRLLRPNSSRRGEPGR